MIARGPCLAAVLAIAMAGIAAPAAVLAGGDLAAIAPIRTDLTPKDQARVMEVTRPADAFDKAERFEAMPGGAATSKKLVNRDAFSNFSANLDFEGQRDFKLGNALFRKVWVSAPASTQASDGLGPLFNARACQSCHLKDGRGHPPQGSEEASSMFLRLARPAASDAEQMAIDKLEALNFADPVYGGQLQDFAVTGLRSEGRMTIRYEEVPVTLADGSVVSLRRPHYGVSDLSLGPLDPATTLSPRIAPPMIGLGLVQAIHEADIAALADPGDANNDGISGKMQIVRHPQTGEPALGRFGWKGENATIRAQAAGAFSGDMGISTPDRPDPHGECTMAQLECRAAPTGVQERLGDTEAPDPVLDLVTFYSENLAVPARRDIADKAVLAGKALFYGSGCASCHVPKFVTSRDAAKPQAFQLIWPYSDFLLHDMGVGLADGQQVGRATGSEWRTPPLWGIGLTQTVSGHSFLLHDGRARNATEAILWHGGEAKKARDAFAAMQASDRDALLKFLESL